MAPGVAEYNRTNTAMEELLGVHETAQYSGEGTYFNTTVFWVRQDLPYVAMLDTVDLKPTTREHFAEQVRPSLCISHYCFAMARRKSQNAQDNVSVPSFR